jgi:ATP-binding cassette, subfamily B, vacuolar membrane transporter HMT1/ACLQ
LSPLFLQTQLATVIVVLRDAVAGHSAASHVAFPDSAYLASYVGVLLYFLAGLLPDPEGPWSPVAANGHAWVAGVLLEAVIAAVLETQQPAIGLSRDVVDTLFGLGLARIVVLLVMIGLMAIRQYKLRSFQSPSAPEERQSLLGNGTGNGTGHGPVADYGGAHGPGHAHGHGNGHGPAIKPVSGKRPGVQGTGWLDYFAGFHVLFPYLWYVAPHILSHTRSVD